MNELVAEAFRQDAMERCYEQTLWQDYSDATKQAQASLDIKDGLYARKAYTRFIRSQLTDVEQQLFKAEDEIIALRAENKTLRERMKSRLAARRGVTPP